MKTRICVMTAGQLSTCPRLVKAADALTEAGYDVRVVSARFMDWATEGDRELRRTRSWRWSVVDYHRATGRRTHLRSGARCRTARAGVRLIGAERAPLGLAARAFGRVHPELVRAALAEPADLFYGGTTGGLAAAAAAGRRAGVPYALDLEDFFAGEHPDDRPDGRRANALAARIERAVLPGAAFLTAGSAAIAAAYRERYGVSAIPIHNTFPLPALPPALAPSPGPGLRLYWFGQTLGPGRGIEDAVRAMAQARIPGEIRLRGVPAAGILEYLGELAAGAPDLRIVPLEPAAPNRMVELCAGHDAGLAAEQAQPLNRNLCLTNKALTYILAGMPIAASATPGQTPLARDLGEGAFLYPPGDVTALARGLQLWAGDRERLGRARAAAWEAARRRWHWEHPLERGALLGAVERTVAA
jgi:glycosyltransferase involved in cell wall biosynthesis